MAIFTSGSIFTQLYSHLVTFSFSYIPIWLYSHLATFSIGDIPTWLHSHLATWSASPVVTIFLSSIIWRSEGGASEGSTHKSRPATLRFTVGIRRDMGSMHKLCHDDDDDENICHVQCWDCFYAYYAGMYDTH